MDLDRINALAKEESSLNQVDLLAQQEEMMENMENRLKLNLVEAITEFAEKFEEKKPSASNDDDDKTSITSALSAITDTTSSNEQLLKILTSLSKKVDRLEAKCTPATASQSENDNEHINPRTGQPWRRYCWTHGCCDHWSRACPQRKPGHKPGATFKNRMGGSKKGVIGA